MTSITWITRGKKKAITPKQKKFITALSHSYFEVEFKSLPKEVLASSDWVQKNISSKLSFVFVSDSDPNFVKSVCDNVRALATPEYPAPCVCFVVEEKVDKKAAVLLETGIDESLSLLEKTDALVLRLNLRHRQISELHKARQKTREQSIQSAKTETTLKQREEFLGVCAHDLRSPLGLIQSSLTMVLSAKNGLTEFQTELITRARRQAGQAITLVNDLMDVMSYEQGLKPQYGMLNLHDFLSEFYKDYSFHSEQKKIHFHYHNPVPDWRTLADADRIRQLLQNLFVNALKFTAPEKNIYLNVTPFTGRRKNDPPYPMVVVSLRDEGKGIPPNELQKIFDKFTQVKDQARHEGRGLGLTVAKQISTLHDGNIWVESEEGKGSTFNVLFPHVVSRTDAPLLQENTIIVAEPDEKKRDEQYGVLSRWGYKVHFAKDGVEAITYAFYHLPVAVILCENLGKISEEEVANILKADLLTREMALFLAQPAVNPHSKNYSEVPFDAFFKLPLNKEVFTNAIHSARQRFTKAA